MKRFLGCLVAGLLVGCGGGTADDQEHPVIQRIHDAIEDSFAVVSFHQRPLGDGAYAGTLLTTSMENGRPNIHWREVVTDAGSSARTVGDPVPERWYKATHSYSVIGEFTDRVHITECVTEAGDLAPFGVDSCLEIVNASDLMEVDDFVGLEMITWLPAEYPVDAAVPDKMFYEGGPASAWKWRMCKLAADAEYPGDTCEIPDPVKL